MKKLFLISTCLTSLLLLSCKKNYTCSCVRTIVTTAYTQYSVYHPQTTEATTTKYSYNDREDDAKTRCKNLEDIRIDSYGTGTAAHTVSQTVECELY